MAERDADGRFHVTLADGSRASADRLILATGIRDELPALPGLAERWGVSVLHCPYCHGYEVSGQRLGVLATHPLSVHQAILIPDCRRRGSRRAWSKRMKRKPRCSMRAACASSGRRSSKSSAMRRGSTHCASPTGRSCRSMHCSSAHARRWRAISRSSSAARSTTAARPGRARRCNEADERRRRIRGRRRVDADDQRNVRIGVGRDGRGGRAPVADLGLHA